MAKVIWTSVNNTEHQDTVGGSSHWVTGLWLLLFHHRSNSNFLQPFPETNPNSVDALSLNTTPHKAGYTVLFLKVQEELVFMTLIYCNHCFYIGNFASIIRCKSHALNTVCTGIAFCQSLVRGCVIWSLVWEGGLPVTMKTTIWYEHTMGLEL